MRVRTAAAVLAGGLAAALGAGELPEVAEEAGLLQLQRQLPPAGADADGSASASPCAKEFEPCDHAPCCSGFHLGIGGPGTEESGFFCHPGAGFQGPAYRWEACEDLDETYFGKTCAQWGSQTVLNPQLGITGPTCKVSAGVNSVCPVTCGHCAPGEMHWSSKAAWRVLYPDK